MIQANMHEAKTRLSKLIERALEGEEVLIARDGSPVVRLQPITTSGDQRPRIVGCMAEVVRWPSPGRERRVDQGIAAEMQGVDKFDVELSDELEFIPGPPR